MSPRSITMLSTDPQTDERSKTTGLVEVHVVLDWLKDRPIATAELTPREARHFAELLLAAARRATYGREDDQ